MLRMRKILTCHSLQARTPPITGNRQPLTAQKHYNCPISFYTIGEPRKNDSKQPTTAVEELKHSRSTRKAP